MFWMLNFNTYKTLFFRVLRMYHQYATMCFSHWGIKAAFDKNQKALTYPWWNGSWVATFQCWNVCESNDLPSRWMRLHVFMLRISKYGHYVLWICLGFYWWGFQLQNIQNLYIRHCWLFEILTEVQYDVVDGISIEIIVLTLIVFTRASNAGYNLNVH